jgi:hypothetical protein
LIFRRSSVAKTGFLSLFVAKMRHDQEKGLLEWDEAEMHLYGRRAKIEIGQAALEFGRVGFLIC